MSLTERLPIVLICIIHWIDFWSLRIVSPYILMITHVVLLLSPVYLCIIVQGLFECMHI